MTSESAFVEINIQELFQLLPHRYPFLLLDKIVDVNEDLSATGIKNVTFNEPQFGGHFPENPIMPGVMIVEAMAQTAGAICAKAHSKGKRKLVYFMTIDGAKFRRPVVPGDQLQLRVIQLKQRRNIFKYDCEAWVGEEKAAEAIISAMMVDPEEYNK